MSRFYTVELNKAQKVHNRSVCYSIDVCVQIEREMEDEITEKDDRIAQLEQQVIYNNSQLS